MDRRSFVGRLTAALGVAAVAPSVLRASEPTPVLPTATAGVYPSVMRTVKSRLKLPYRIHRDFEIRKSANPLKFILEHTPSGRLTSFSTGEGIPTSARIVQHGAYHAAKMAQHYGYPL